MADIIAKKYKDTNKFSLENSNNFLEAKPFPYIELENFFDEDYLNQILDSFPKMSENKHDFNMNTKAEVKLAIGSPEKIPNKINSFIEYLNSYFFLDFLQKLTGIKQRLIPDPYLFGAGLHEIKKGGLSTNPLHIMINGIIRASPRPKTINCSLSFFISI